MVENSSVSLMEYKDISDEKRKANHSESPNGNLVILPSVSQIVRKTRSPGNSLSSGIPRVLITEYEGQEFGGCVRAIFDLLEFYGFSRRDGQSVQSKKAKRAYELTLVHWKACLVSMGGDHLWMSLAKYKFAAFFYHGWSITPDWRGREDKPQWDSPPVSPIPDCCPDKPLYLANSLAGRFGIRLLRDRSTCHSFLSSVLQLKKGCPRPSKELVDQGVSKTAENLCSDRKKPFLNRDLLEWGDITGRFRDYMDYSLNQQTMERQIRRFVKEIFDEKADSFDLDDLLDRPFVPSTRAARGEKCGLADGGAFEWLREFSLNGGFSNYSDEHLTAERFEELVKISRDEYKEEAIRSDGISFSVDSSALKLRFKRFYYSVLRSVIDDEKSNIVVPVGLAEALKVRVITKGDPRRNFLLRPVQTFLAQTLRKKRIFQLTGGPVDSDIIQDVLGEELHPHQAYLSGDYSQATDNLAPWVCETVARELSEAVSMPQCLRRLFLEGLTGHFIDFDSKIRPQLWGQLMGSIVSFPVLCVANAVVCRWSMEIGLGRSVKLKKARLLINGDDCLFITNRRGLDAWKLISTFAGLSPLVGKFYFSPAFAQINSLNFVRLSEPNLRFINYDHVNDVMITEQKFFEQIPYVNLGLIHGMKRSGPASKSDISDGRNSLGTACTEAVRCAPQGMEKTVIRKFIYHNYAVLKSTTLPWFIPEHLGGVGLPWLFEPRDDVDEPLVPVANFGPTEKDLRVAKVILNNLVKFPVGRMSIPSIWKLHEYVQDVLPKEGLHDMKIDSAEYRSFATLYARLVSEGFFSCPQTFDPSKKGKSYVLRRNEKSWKNAYNVSNWPPPASFQELTSSPRTVGITVRMD